MFRFRFRSAGQYLYFLRHRVQQVWRRIRRVQNGGEDVDGVENVLVDGEENLGNLGFRVCFQLFLDICGWTFQSNNAFSCVFNDVWLGGYK